MRYFCNYLADLLCSTDHGDHLENLDAFGLRAAGVIDFDSRHWAVIHARVLRMRCPAL